jgi:hypothetical protein
MKFTWGNAIFLVMTAFILLMTSFMIRAASNQEELVAENYYELEVKYQQQIDKLNNTGSLSDDVLMEIVGTELIITFPAEVKGMTLSGELYLQRPSDSRADARIPVRVDAHGRMTVPVDQRLKGAYNALLEWKAGENEYLSLDRIHVP